MSALAHTSKRETHVNTQREEEHNVDLVAFFERYIPNLKSKKTKTHGGEYAGACPLPGCSSQNDAFLLWPFREPDDGPLWTCRKCRTSGNLRSFIYKVAPHDYGSICHELGLTLSHNYEPRGAASKHESTVLAGFELVWKDAAHWFARACVLALFDGSEISNKWLAYLYSRGFTDDTIKAAHIGLNKETVYDKPANWGVSEENRKTIWLPRGLVIPWKQGNKIVKLNIRRAPNDVKRDAAEGRPKAKYVEVTGSEQGALYGLDSIIDGAPLALCEGEFDCLSLMQELRGEALGFVATGSAARGLTDENIAHLSRASTQLVTFDFDANGAGDSGAAPWLAVLPRGFHWSPPVLGLDVNGMLQEKEDIKAWFLLGLESAQKHLDLQASRARTPEYNDKGVTTLPQEKYPPKIASHIEELNRAYRCECGEAGAVHGKDGVYYCAMCAFERMPIDYTPPTLIGTPLDTLLFLYMSPLAHNALESIRCFACKNEATHYDLHSRSWCVEHAPQCAGVIGESLLQEAIDPQDGETCYLCACEIAVVDLHLRYYCAGCAPATPYIDAPTLDTIARLAVSLNAKEDPQRTQAAPACLYEPCEKSAAPNGYCEEHANRALLLNMLESLEYPVIDGGTFTLISGKKAALDFATHASTEAFCAVLVVVYRLYKHIPTPPPPSKVTHLDEARKKKRPRVPCSYYACNKEARYIHASGLGFCENPGCEERYAFMLKAEACGYPQESYMPVFRGRGMQTLKQGVEAYKAFAIAADWRDVETIANMLEQEQKESEVAL